jgi:hypothetical protein
MIRIEFSEQDLKKIQQLRHASTPKGAQANGGAVAEEPGPCAPGDLSARGNFQQHLTAVPRDVSVRWYQEADGAQLLRPDERVGAASISTRSPFPKHPPATINQAATMIEELTGITRSPSAVGRFLNSLGMAPRRVGTIPSKADPEEQEHFRINKLEPRLEEARQGKRAIFLSMLLTLYWVPFSVFRGHSPVSL